MAGNINPMSQSMASYRYVQKLQESLSDITRKIASGNRYDDFKGYAGEGSVESLTSLSSELNDIDTYVKNNNTVKSRIQTANNAVNNLVDVAGDLAKLLAARRGPSGENVPVQLEAKSLLQKIEANLNAKYLDRHLFSGSKIDEPAVKNIFSENLDNNNNPTDNYYNGDAVLMSSKASDYEDVDYGVLASDPAFQGLIAAVHIAMKGDKENNDELLSKAVDMANKAVSDITTVSGKLKTNVSIIDRVNSGLNDVRSYVDENFVKLSETDLVEAVTTSNEIQPQIQAAFMMLSKMSDLRLTNYL